MARCRDDKHGETVTLDLDTETEFVARQVIGAALTIHRRLGPGLLESVYEVVLAHELRVIGLHVLRQQTISFRYGDVQFDEGFRVDLLVEGRLVIEIKSVATMEPLFGRQLLTYLRLMDLRLGIVLNFGASTMKEGIRRVVNSMPSFH